MVSGRERFEPSVLAGWSGAQGYEKASCPERPGDLVSQERDRPVHSQLVESGEDRKHIHVEDATEAVVGDEQHRLSGVGEIAGQVEAVIAAHSLDTDRTESGRRSQNG